jgi:AcrR family transcriptional regulator
MSKRDEIIDAAIKEFGRHSYDAASINRIIKDSGTSKGTFYHYFKDKKALYFSVMESIIEVKQRYMSSMMNDVKNEGIDFFEMIKRQTKAVAALIEDNPDLWKFGMMYTAEQGPIRKEVDERYILGIGSSFIKIIEAGIANNNFTDRYPPEFIARIIWYMTMHYFDVFFDMNETPTTKEIENRLEMLFDFLKRGFT